MAQCWYLKNGPLTAGAIVSRSRSGASRGQLQSHGATELGRGDSVIGRSVIFPKGEELGKGKQDILFSKTRGFGVLPTLSLRDLVGFCAS